MSDSRVLLAAFLVGWAFDTFSQRIAPVIYGWLLSLVS